jgi:hypothetical protein
LVLIFVPPVLEGRCLHREPQKRRSSPMPGQQREHDGGFRKPDADIFRIALDIAQTAARKVVYIAPMFAQIVEGLGIRSILHIDYRSTCVKLASFGLQNGERVIHETS